MPLPSRPSLIEICDAVYGDHNAGRSLSGCFANAIAAYFDPAYEGSKDRSSNFGNYGPKLSLNYSYISFGYDGNACSGSSSTINIISNGDWTCELSPNLYFDISASGGSGDGSITVSTQGTHMEGSDYIVDINFYMDGVLMDTCSITQYAFPNECA